MSPASPLGPHPENHSSHNQLLHKAWETAVTTEEHIMISDDLNHDKFAVRKFEELSLQHLKSKGIAPKFIVIVSDNCKS